MELLPSISFKKLGLCATLIFLPFGVSQDSAAQSSFLDTDFFCQNFGCVVVHDGQTFDIYDNWQFATNSCCVPFGAQMISFFNRADQTNLSGTTQRSFNFRPDENQSFRLGIIQASNGEPTLSTFDDGDGYLDAGDTLSAFSISEITDVALEADGRTYAHSIFITSRDTRFSIRAQADIASATGDFADTLGLEDIEVAVGITQRGNDDGFEFGDRARTATAQFNNDVSTLADLEGAQVEIAQFRNPQGIRIRNGSINQQVIRLDLEYTMPEYDLSMGLGSLDVDLTIDFFREP